MDLLKMIIFKIPICISDYYKPNLKFDTFLIIYFCPMKMLAFINCFCEFKIDKIMIIIGFLFDKMVQILFQYESFVTSFSIAKDLCIVFCTFRATVPMFHLWSQQPLIWCFIFLISKIPSGIHFHYLNLFKLLSFN